MNGTIETPKMNHKKPCLSPIPKLNNRIFSNKNSNIGAPKTKNSKLAY